MDNMDNDDILFNTIKTEVIKWVANNMDRFTEEKIDVKEVANNSNIYSVVFDFDNCMAEIDVTQPGFAPYRFVCFLVAGIENNRPGIIYTWDDTDSTGIYDNDSTGIEEILFQLNKGIKYATNYCGS